LQVGVVAGSQTVNIVPDHCIADIEVRAAPGVSPSSLLEPVKAQLFALRDGGFVVAWHELNAYPALSLAERSELTGQEPLVAVSFGTEPVCISRPVSMRSFALLVISTQMNIPRLANSLRARG
jgi:acetylornithine deacetylase